MYQLREPGNSIIIRETKSDEPEQCCLGFGDKYRKCQLHNNALLAFSLYKALTLITSFLKAMRQRNKIQHQKIGLTDMQKNTHINIDPNTVQIYSEEYLSKFIFTTD